MKRIYFILPMLLLTLISCGRVGPTENPQTLETVSSSYHLSDLTWKSAKNGLGPFEKDSSNGGLDGGDGLTLTINGVNFTKRSGVAGSS